MKYKSKVSRSSLGETPAEPREDDLEKTLRAAEQLYRNPILKQGLVAVAKYYPGKPVAQKENFKSILIHTDGRKLGGDLSPYILRNEQGQLLENIWQFSKVYAKVQPQRIPLSRFQPQTIIWEYPEEVHCKEGIIQSEFWKWREMGMKNQHPVRYPNGFKGRQSCLFSVWKSNNSEAFERLDYIQARKRIYCGEYARLAPHTAHFRKLLAMLQHGENLLLVEVDGPDPTLDFPPYDQISVENPALLINEETTRLLVNDPRKPFGHGFVIAALLLGGQQWIT